MARYALELGTIANSTLNTDRVAARSIFHSPLKGAVDAIVTIPRRIAAEIERRLGPDGEIVCEAIITGSVGGTVGLRIVG